MATSAARLALIVNGISDSVQTNNSAWRSLREKARLVKNTLDRAQRVAIIYAHKEVNLARANSARDMSEHESGMSRIMSTCLDASYRLHVESFCRPKHHCSNGVNASAGECTPRNSGTSSNVSGISLLSYLYEYVEASRWLPTWNLTVCFLPPTSSTDSGKTTHRSQKHPCTSSDTF